MSFGGFPKTGDVVAGLGMGFLAGDQVFGWGYGFRVGVLMTVRSFPQLQPTAPPNLISGWVWFTDKRHDS